MSRITKLTLQKNKRIVNIFIDNHFSTSLDLITVTAKGLKKGIDISPSELKAIKKESLHGKLLNRAHHFLSYRPRSEKEIKTYLRRKLLKETAKNKNKIIEEVINKLKDQQIINDQKFAKWWVEQRINFRPKGTYVLKRELFSKGINKEDVDEVLSTIDEISVARAVIKKKSKIIKEKDPFIIKKKLIGYLQRRGFSWSTIKSVVDESLTKK